MQRLTAMTDRVCTPQVVSRLRIAADDPKVKLSKATLIEAADVIDALIAGLIDAHKESNGASAQLSTLAECSDTKYAVRDARLCTHHLKRQQATIREALVKAGC